MSKQPWVTIQINDIEYLILLMRESRIRENRGVGWPADEPVQRYQKWLANSERRGKRGWKVMSLPLNEWQILERRRNGDKDYIKPEDVA